MLSVLMKLPLLSLTATEDADLKKPIGEKALTAFLFRKLKLGVSNTDACLHFHLGVVDQILQRVRAGIVIVEFSVICDYSCRGVV